MLASLTALPYGPGPAIAYALIVGPLAAGAYAWAYAPELKRFARRLARRAEP